MGVEVVKRVGLGILFIFMGVGTVFGSPYLVCDPYPTTVVQPTYFTVGIDSLPVVNSVSETLTDGSKRLHYDLVGVGVGGHTASVAACNEWGCSTAVPFVFTKGVPGVPSTLKLSPN